MLWVILPLISTLLWAIGNILDKFVSTRYIKDPIALAASFGIFSILFNLILFLFTGIPNISIVYWIFAFLAGIFLAYAIIPYIKSLVKEEASRVVPLWHLSALFTLILAVIFLGEILTAKKYIAFALILSGGMIISTKKIKGMFGFSPAMWLMMFSSLLVSISDILLKYIYSLQTFFQTFQVFHLGMSLGFLSLFLSKIARKNFAKALKSHKYKFLALVFVSSFFGFIGQILYGTAILRAPITLVSVFISFQSLFVVLLATFLSFKFPLFIKEAIDFKTIGIKIAAIAIMAFGLVLLV